MLTFQHQQETDLLQNIWNSDTIPEDWSEGIIAKIPQKMCYQELQQLVKNYPFVCFKRGVLQSPFEQGWGDHWHHT